MGLCQYTVINPHALQEWGIRYETYIKFIGYSINFSNLLADFMGPQKY